MNYYVRHKLYRNAAIVGNVGIVASSIDCLEAIHDELFFELDEHVTLKYDPQRPVLNDGVVEIIGIQLRK